MNLFQISNDIDKLPVNEIFISYLDEDNEIYSCSDMSLSPKNVEQITSGKAFMDKNLSITDNTAELERIQRQIVEKEDEELGKKDDQDDQS